MSGQDATKSPEEIKNRIHSLEKNSNLKKGSKVHTPDLKKTLAKVR